MLRPKLCTFSTERSNWRPIFLTGKYRLNSWWLKKILAFQKVLTSKKLQNFDAYKLLKVKAANRWLKINEVPLIELEFLAKTILRSSHLSCIYTAHFLQDYILWLPNPKMRVIQNHKPNHVITDYTGKLAHLTLLNQMR